MAPKGKGKDEDDKMYQFGEDLKRLETSQCRLEENQQRAIECLENINLTLNKMSDVIVRFPDILEEQTRQKAVIKQLAKDNEIFKSFMANSHCRTHEERFNTVNKRIDGIETRVNINSRTDENQNKNLSTFIINFIVALVAIGGTLFVTLLTK